MAIKIGHATHDENNSLHGGKAGDQGNTEVFVRNWYNRPWNCVIEFNDPKMAEKAAVAMEHACANNNIGYDQYQRNTLLTEARKVGYDPGKVTKAVETDCSALVSLCCMYAGIPESMLYKDGNSCTTSTLRDALESTGKVTTYTDKKRLSSGDYNHRGAILLYEGHHTAIQLEDGEYASKDYYGKQEEPELVEEDFDLDPADPTQEFQSYMATVNTTALNVRSGIGTTYKIVDTYRKGKVLSVNREVDRWGYVNNVGWVSLKYCKTRTKITGKVIAYALNVREAPKDGEVIKTIKLNAKVKITKLTEDATWGYDSASKGWVSLRYIEF